MQKNRYVLLLFLIGGFLIYGQTIGFQYTYLDDHTLILEKMDQLRQADYFKKAFTEEVFHSGSGKGYYYRPVLTISFILDAMAGKGKFEMFHISNILYHVLATWLFFLFFLALGFDRLKSFVAAALFLVHPLMVQAVAWVPGRNDSLLAIFALLSILTWIRYIRTNNTWSYSLHFLLYLTALMTKENALVLPVLLSLFTVFILKQPLKKLGLPVLIWLILTIGWAWIRYRAIGGDSGVPLVTQIASLFGNLPALLPYLGKLMFPFFLSVFPILADMKASLFLGILALVIIGVMVWKTSKPYWPMILFGLLWFLAFLLPAFIAITHQIPNFSEHRSYAAMMGLFIVLFSCAPLKELRFGQWKVITALSIIGLLFIVLTVYHSRHFKDNITFWTNAAESSPTHAFNYNNLGAMYFLEGDKKTAEPLFRKALSINPNEPMANSNLGLICMNTNRLTEAESYYLREIAINPKFEHVYYNLGLLYYGTNRVEKSLPLWEKNLTMNPYYTDAYVALLQVYKQLNRPDDYNRIFVMAEKYKIRIQ